MPKSSSNLFIFPSQCAKCSSIINILRHASPWRETFHPSLFKLKYSLSSTWKHSGSTHWTSIHTYFLIQVIFNPSICMLPFLISKAKVACCSRKFIHQEGENASKFCREFLIPWGRTKLPKNHLKIFNLTQQCIKGNLYLSWWIRSNEMAIL